jgi:MFS family permease
LTQRILAHRQRLVTEQNSRWWTLGAMCFALFMVMLDNTVVNVALPSIQRSLHASLSASSSSIPQSRSSPPPSLCSPPTSRAMRPSTGQSISPGSPRSLRG